MKWEMSTLGDLVSVYGGKIQTGPFGSQLHQHDYKSEGIPVVMPKDIVKDRIDISSVARINDDDADRLSKHKLCIGDLVLPRRGDINKRAICKPENEGWLCGTGCLKIRLNDDIVNPNYLYYFFTLANVVEGIMNKAVGSTMLNLSGSILSKVELLYPPLPTQRKIAGILSAYDDLIENNLKRIKLLEEQALCEYKLITDFVTTETLGNILSLNYGKSLSADNRTPGIYHVYGSSGRVGLNENFLVKGPGIIVGRKGNVGTVFWSQTDFFPIDTVYYVVSDISLYFLYFNLKYRQHFNNSDAAVPGLNRNSALSNKIYLPSVQTIKKFEKYCEPIFDLVNLLQIQNTKLREARDILLPKLMNGQIEV